MNRLDTRDRPAGKASRQAARQREREGCSQTMAKKSRYIVAEANRFFGPSAAFFGWQETALKTNNVMNQRSQDKSKCTDLSRVVLEGSVLESNMFQTSLAWLLNAQNFAFFIRLAFHAQCSCCQFPTEDFLRCVVYLIRQSVERERVDSNALKVQSSHGHRLLQQWVWSIQESLGKHGQSPGIKGVWWDRRRCNVATCCHRIAQMHTDATCCKTLGRALPWLNCCRTARSTRFFTKSAAFSKPCPRSSTPSASS